MPTPLKGTSGRVQANGISVQWVADWESQMENASQELGPHIGDPTLYEVDTSQKRTFTINGTVPAGGDPGQLALITAAESRLTTTLELRQYGGFYVSFTAARFASCNLQVAADGSQTFSIEGSNGSGTWTVGIDA
jgi:hypothetical protein